MLTANAWKNHQYGKMIMDNVVIPAFRSAGLPDLERLQLCGQLINTITCRQCGTVHFAGYWRCMNRWCVNCNRIKIKSWLARLIPILEVWLDEGKFLTLLNLTIKDTVTLEEGLMQIETSWRMMQNNNKVFRKRWKARFPGGIRSLEVKRGKYSKQWHPHYHCLVMQDTKEKDFEWVKEAWEHCTKLCSCRTDEKQGSVYLKQIKRDKLLVGVVETLKYIMKPENSLYENTSDLQEAWMNLKGKRQVNTWGLLRGLSKQVEEDMLHIEEKKLTEFICQRCGCTEGQLESIMYNELADLVLYDC